jgi:hypothetical protein
VVETVALLEALVQTAQAVGADQMDPAAQQLKGITEATALLMVAVITAAAVVAVVDQPQ